MNSILAAALLLPMYCLAGLTNTGTVWAAETVTARSTTESEGRAMTPNPEWVGSQAGLTDQVLKPWTPMEVTGNVISCWGRDYRWGTLPFPEQIITQGNSVLAGPVRVKAVVNGREVVWLPWGEARPAYLLSSKGTQARIERTVQGSGLQLEGMATVEFDGMARIDFTLSALTYSYPFLVDSFVIEIPYKPELATLMHYWPLHDGVNAIANSGSTPMEPYRSDFRPYWWLGDEGGGLSWFAESDENWNPTPSNEAVEILRQGDEVVLRLNIWNRQRVLRGP